MRNYKLIYVLYNEGWLLEESSTYSDDEYYDETIALHGVGPLIVMADFALETDISCIGAPAFANSFCDILYSEIENVYFDNTSDEYYQDVEISYGMFTKKARVHISYILEGYTWIPYVQVEETYLLNNSINGHWSKYIKASHPMHVDSTISVELEKMNDTDCNCSFIWTSRIAGGYDDTFSGTYTMYQNYDFEGYLTSIVLASDSTNGSIKITLEGIVYDTAYVNETYVLDKN